MRIGSDTHLRSEMTVRKFGNGQVGGSSRERLAIRQGLKRVRENLESSANGEKLTSGAEAHTHSAWLEYGLKPVLFKARGLCDKAKALPYLEDGPFALLRGGFAVRTNMAHI
jgi:hypothetical protein